MKKFWKLWRSFWGTHYRIINDETGKEVCIILVFRHKIYLKKSKKKIGVEERKIQDGIKKKLPMLARIFGNRRRIIFVDSLPSDEIVYSCYRIYISSIYKKEE